MQISICQGSLQEHNVITEEGTMYEAGDFILNSVFRKL